jgi:hypothetical protein
MKLNRIPRIHAAFPGRSEIATRPSLLARMARALGRRMRGSVIDFHIKSARAELSWLEEYMAQDAAALAKDPQFGRAALEARQDDDRLQRAFLQSHLSRLHAQRAALKA